MSTKNKSDLGSISTLLYASILCNIAVLLIYAVNAIRYDAPLLGFWLPAFGFFVAYGYISPGEYKKQDTYTLTTWPNSLKFGIFFLLVSIYILATKNWKALPLNFSDAFIWSFLLSSTKDQIVHVLAIRKFASMTDVQ